MTKYHFDLRDLALALGGEIANGQVIAPGPNHSARDRSMAVRLSANSADGFVVFSHAQDDFRECRDYMRARLGLDPEGWKKSREPFVKALRPVVSNSGEAEAGAIWKASVDPRGTLAEAYLRSRGLDLPDDLAGPVLRWNAGANALIGLFRNIHTNQPQAVTRIFLDKDGRKLKRMFLGPVGCAAVMLDPHEHVSFGLSFGEGVESSMSGRQLGFRPAWAVGSAGAIGAFPLLSGVNSVTVFAETDDTGANARALEKLAARWQEDGREVLTVTPRMAGDMNDVLKAKGRVA